MLHSIAGKFLKSSYFWFLEKSGLLQLSPTVACSGRRGEASFGGGEASERKGLGAGRGDGQEICERT